MVEPFFLRALVILALPSDIHSILLILNVFYTFFKFQFIEQWQRVLDVIVIWPIGPPNIVDSRVNRLSKA